MLFPLLLLLKAYQHAKAQFKCHLLQDAFLDFPNWNPLLLFLDFYWNEFLPIGMLTDHSHMIESLYIVEPWTTRGLGAPHPLQSRKST